MIFFLEKKNLFKFLFTFFFFFFFEKKKKKIYRSEICMVFKFNKRITLFISNLNLIEVKLNDYFEFKCLTSIIK
jgi:hypothetical protein